jgi:uncharacterized protein (DUF1499 family)
MALAAAQRPSRLAPWALRVVLLSLQLIVAAAALHRMAAFSTSVAVNLMLIGLGGCVLAVLLALAAMARIWHFGHSGAGQASAALLVGCLTLLAPAYYLPSTLRDTSISDVATDPTNPPVFVALARARLSAGAPADAAELTPPAPELELEPLVVDRSASDVFDLANDVIRQLDLTIAAEEAPGFGSETGSIEATERTMILGLTDDVAIRITPVGNRTRVDIRSAARYPRLDFGRNGERVRSIARKLQSGIDASLASDPALADAAPAPDVGLKPAGTSGAGTGVRRKKRGPAPRGAPDGPAPTISQR